LNGSFREDTPSKRLVSSGNGSPSFAVNSAFSSFVSGFLNDPRQLRDDLDVMIERERSITHDSPKREAKAWLHKLAEVERKSSRFRDMAAESLITFDELRKNSPPSKKPARRRSGS
jgi:hypothetical protein